MAKQHVRAQFQTAPMRRHLYCVPHRVVRREPWVPGGRTLHLVDIENLMGGPFQGTEVLEAACRAYRALAGIGPTDHVVIASNGAIALAAGVGLLGCRLLIGYGPDGADLALLAQLRDLDWTASRYDRVIVGSGDGIFADAVRDLRQLGIPVGVTSRRRALAYDLAMAATFVVYLPDLPNAGAVA